MVLILSRSLQTPPSQQRRTLKARRCCVLVFSNWCGWRAIHVPMERLSALFVPFTFQLFTDFTRFRFALYRWL